MVNLSLETYKEAWKPWKQALFLLLLGKTDSLKVLKGRLDSLWNLQWSCEGVDLVEGFLVVRFRSREDYKYVLENGPWIILGHYLAVFKWRPFFNPATETLLSTMVWILLPKIARICVEIQLQDRLLL